MANSDVMLQFLERYGPSAGGDGPVLFVKEVLGALPDPWQERTLRAYGRGERRMAIRSCHGVGKTTVTAWVVVHSLVCRFPQKTQVTAPTSSQLEDALIAEVLKWFGELPPMIQDLYSVKSARIELKMRPELSFFAAKTSRAEKPEALQGVHCDPGFVLLIADEASGVPEQVYEAAAGSMSGHNAQTLLIGNPTRTSGFFYDVFHKLKDMWFTIHVSHKDSSRVSDDFVLDMARRYGENSNAFRVRCLGEFPRTDDDTMIPFELVQSARGRDIAVSRKDASVWGLDVARFGTDKNALTCRSAREVRWIKMWGQKDLMETVGMVKAAWDDTPHDERPEVILVDVIGLGGGVVDRLRELSLPVRGINVGETAASRERFQNAKAELWWEAREWLARKDVRLPSATPGMDPRSDPAEVLADELVVPKYKFSSTGKLVIESKEEIKKRGHNSPDVADSFVLTFATDLTKMVSGRMGSTSWNEPIKRGLSVV